MGLVLLINSDHDVRQQVKDAFVRNSISGYTVKMISKEKRAFESLNFDLPEVVIINCADPNLSYKNLIAEARKDSWLHSFGIIGLYNGEDQDEQNIAKEFLDLNLLAMLDLPRIRSHLYKSISIILENRQLVFQRELASRLADRSSGSFEIENDPLAVPIYAGIASTNLVQRGYLKPEKKMYLQLALSELIINGIEHGNCSVGYEEKSKKMENGHSVVDIILEKCKDPEIDRRRVHFTWESEHNKSTFVIRDDGEGFDVSAVREQTDNQDPLSSHGRGISMAETLTDELTYNEKGNEATLVVYHETGAEKRTPEGFSNEEVL
ncbi:MAG: ATP-binding protein [Spirochaetia bacterium]